ncbi:MAG: hypothetical protein ACLTG4_07790 [Oscillospiraceae bacterium]
MVSNFGKAIDPVADKRRRSPCCCASCLECWWVVAFWF